jgi:cupin superfamily acireductone dioxygenase involved in methionine salvage
MAVFYRYEEKEITQFITNPYLLKIELEKYGIYYSTDAFNDLDKFADSVLKKFGYTNWDIHRSTLAITSRDLHYHMYAQARMIIKGSGTFYFEIDDFVIELVVDPGDFIAFPPKVVHYFNTIVPVVALRFFSTDARDDDKINAYGTYDL